MIIQLSVLFGKTQQSTVRMAGALRPGNLGLDPSPTLGARVTLGKFFQEFSSLFSTLGTLLTTFQACIQIKHNTSETAAMILGIKGA